MSYYHRNSIVSYGKDPVAYENGNADPDIFPQKRSGLHKQVLFPEADLLINPKQVSQDK